MDLTRDGAVLPSHGVRLGPPGRLAGRVEEADGRPSAGAEVLVVDGSADPGFAVSEFATTHWFGPGRPFLVACGRSVTGEDGAFAVEDLPPGPLHVLATRHPPVAAGTAGKPLRAILPSVSAARDDLVLALPPDPTPPAGGLEGTVIDGATGFPVPAIHAYLGREGTWVSAVEAGRVLGRFRFEGVPEGRWDLKVGAYGYAPAVVEGIEVRAGSVGTAPPVALERGATLEGRLAAAGGIQVGGRNVGLVPEDRGKAGGSAVTAPVAKDGSFRAAGLLPGRWRISVDGTPAAAVAGTPAFEIPAGGSPLRREWRVVRAGNLFARTEAGAAPARGGRVEVLDETGALLFDEEWAPGPKARPWGPRTVAPGAYTVRLVPREGMPEEQRAVVVEGETAVVTFRIP